MAPAPPSLREVTPDLERLAEGGRVVVADLEPAAVGGLAPEAGQVPEGVVEEGSHDATVGTARRPLVGATEGGTHHRFVPLSPGDGRQRQGVVVPGDGAVPEVHDAFPVPRCSRHDDLPQQRVVGPSAWRALTDGGRPIARPPSQLVECSVVRLVPHEGVREVA